MSDKERKLNKIFFSIENRHKIVQDSLFLHNKSNLKKTNLLPN